MEICIDMEIVRDLVSSVDDENDKLFNRLIKENKTLKRKNAELKKQLIALKKSKRNGGKND